MTSNSRIPQLLAPYVENVPNDSLILLTGTLSNNISWLLVRFLCGVFSNDPVKSQNPVLSQEEPGDGANPTSDHVGIILVSWMRDWEFWKAESRRAGGLDLTSLSQNRRLVFVDGLTTAFSQATVTPQSRNTLVPLRSTLISNSNVPARGPPPSTLRAQVTASTPASPAAVTTVSHAHSISSLEIAKVQKSIEEALSSLSTSSALLILDSPDLLLALQDPTTNDPKSSCSSAIQALILSLRLHPRVHATILSLPSDIHPLPSTRPEYHVSSPLEVESQAVLVGVAHTADLIISARGLDTGAAGDVGGVLRITASDAKDTEGPEWKNQELLYLVKNDGSAKVWERGAGVG